jgi:hypothetical protein
MTKWWSDLLFLFAVAAGAAYELVYEPIRALICFEIRIIVRATESAVRRRRSTAGEAPSRMV